MHTRKIPLGNDVDLAKTAQLTPGMSGADLAGLVNEAAIRAVRRSSAMVAQVDLDLAVKDFFRSRGEFFSSPFLILPPLHLSRFVKFPLLSLPLLYSLPPSLPPPFPLLFSQAQRRRRAGSVWWAT